MQDDKGLKRIFSLPNIYSLFQDAIGASYSKDWFMSECLKPRPGDKIVDIGCGPADIVSKFPPVEYVGIDVSGPYIEEARRRHGSKALFLHGTTELYRSDKRLRDTDLVLCTGLLHHLEDHEARDVLSFAREILKPGGRFVCIEPCFLSHQSAISRWVMSKDRGQNVRTEREWKNLLLAEFPHGSSQIVTGLIRIPYIHVILEGTK